MIELVALDMAGTTIDEGGAVYQALQQAVEAGGGSLSEADIEAWMGADKRQSIAALTYIATGTVLTESEVESVYQEFHDRLLAAYRAEPPRPIAGVEAAFVQLRSMGVKVALTTGFSADVHGPLLSALGWAVPETVDAVVCTDDVRSARPAPYMIFHAMERCGVMNVAGVLVAGDTPRDLEAGMNAGARAVVGVGTGGVTLAQLELHPHTHLLESLATLPELVASLNAS